MSEQTQTPVRPRRRTTPSVPAPQASIPDALYHDPRVIRGLSRIYDIALRKVAEEESQH